MRLMPLCANPPGVVDALISAGFPAEMVNLDNPEFHIAVNVQPGQEASALAVARQVDTKIQVLD